MHITERIKTFEDALEVTGHPNVPEFSELPEDLRAHFKAHYKLVVIAEALNEGWKVNWANHCQGKYTPTFSLTPTSGFEYCDVWTIHEYMPTHMVYPFSICFRTATLAGYSGKQFLEIWKDLILTDGTEPVSEMSIDKDTITERFSIRDIEPSELYALTEILLGFKHHTDHSRLSDSNRNQLIAHSEKILLLIRQARM
jgi:hypothetical protein